MSAMARACTLAVSIMPCDMAARPSGIDGLNTTSTPMARSTRTAAIPRSGEP